MLHDGSKGFCKAAAEAAHWPTAKPRASVRSQVWSLTGEWPTWGPATATVVTDPNRGPRVSTHGRQILAALLVYANFHKARRDQWEYRGGNFSIWRQARQAYASVVGCAERSLR